jgi:hypothetical protein
MRAKLVAATAVTIASQRGGRRSEWGPVGCVALSFTISDHLSSQIAQLLAGHTRPRAL